MSALPNGPESATDPRVAPGRRDPLLRDGASKDARGGGLRVPSIDGAGTIARAAEPARGDWLRRLVDLVLGRPRHSIASSSKAPTRASSDPSADERIATLLTIAERLTRTFDRDEIFRTIVSELTRELGADAATIRLLREDRLEVVAWAGMSDEVARRLPVFRADEGWFAELARTGQLLVTADIRQDLKPAGYDRYAGIVEFTSDILAPLIHHGTVIGALAVATVQPRRWAPADVAFVSALATHASIAIHNAELFERTESWALQLAVIQAASARMNRQNTVESVGQAIVEETRQIIDYHNCRVYVVEPPDDLEPIAFAGRVGEYEKVDLGLLRTKIGQGLTGWVAQNGIPLLIPDTNADPRGMTIPGTDDVDESMLIVPMRYDERVIGVITVSKLGLHQFNEENLRLLTILSDQAATALESARLLGRSDQLARELRALLDMSSALVGSLDPRQVAHLMAEHLTRAIGVDGCAISYWDRPGDQILTMGWYPPAYGEQFESQYALSDYPATRRVLEELVTVVVDVDDPTADPAEVEVLRQEGSSTLAMLPLVAKGQSIGLVELTSTLPTRFGSSRLELVWTMANEAGMALENAQLYEAARNLADHDHLTGFYNHRYFHERLGEEIVRAQRSRSQVGVLMIDLDDFKLVNDTFGHLFGDRVLTWTAELIRSTLRASDVPARYGGDEFAVILPETDLEAARHAADRILSAFRETPFHGETRGPLPVGVSIGVASFPGDGRSAPELIAAADSALYRVKRSSGTGAELAGAAGRDADVRSIDRAIRGSRVAPAESGLRRAGQGGGASAERV